MRFASTALRSNSVPVQPNSALVTDACERRYRASFGAAQRER
jgi:hypothetical protein